MNKLNLLIFSVGLLIVGARIGAKLEYMYLVDRAEKDDVFDQFCEICIDKLDDGEVYYGD